MDVKMEYNGPAMNGIDGNVKVEPPSAAASPAPQSDDDIYEDAGDLDFSHAVQGLYLTRIPKYLWESWSTLDDDEEIRLGTMRVEGGLEDVKRMSLFLSPQIATQKNIPKEYNMNLANRKSGNTFIFSEKDLHGYAARSKTGMPNKPAGGSYPSRAPNSAFQHRQGQNPQQREPGKRWQPYRRTIPKQTALTGQVQTEVNCFPVENADYKRVMDARAKQALLRPRRETKMVDRQPTGNVHAITGLRQRNAFESGFTTTAKRTAGKAHHLKAARIPKNELKDLIFGCFRRYSYWAIRNMRKALDQPESYLKEVLEEVAVMARSGQYTNLWQLRPEYKESSYDDVNPEIAPEGDAGASEDEDENVKMEDISTSNITLERPDLAEPDLPKRFKYHWIAMSEDQELLARIGQLAGHINLHKTQPFSSQTTAHEQPSPRPSGSSVSRGNTAWKPSRPAPYQIAPGRGRGVYRPYSRNRSLVVNSGTAHPSSPRNLESPVSFSINEPLQTAPSYVTTTGRHKQYINASVLAKVTEQRKRAIEESQQHTAQKHDQWERQRMHQYVAALDAEQHESIALGSPYTSGKTHEIKIDGLRFQVLKGGSKLVRVFGPTDTSRSTPKRANVQGVTFVRSKQGNLYRSGVVRASKTTDKAKKNSSLCKSFTKTGSCRKRKCDLPHVDRAGQIRKHAAKSADAGSTAETSNANDSDLSSDEDDLADTDGDDIDSDDRDDEIVVGVNDTGHQELAQQDDFVQLLGES
ncbi:MAG: hypothetical protein L6R38_008527 [Xanthoria sp. 2 TBL-2021]|nr:MAG: hypothetical protein L6R38_008527 [Xanthoria sp. 2 TBL-2021]